MPPLKRTETLTYVQSTLAYDAVIPETVLAIDILDAGVLVVEDSEGTQAMYTFAAFVAAGGAYTTFPNRVYIKAKKIVGDGAGNVGNGTLLGGSDIALTDINVLH